MLQQTTVEVVTPRFGRFLARFPDVETLAAARERDVLAEWSGLGYYARARNLHRAARAVVLSGRFPRTVQGLRALPGVGGYTAAAVASICFGVPEPVVDGNVIRVLCRYHGLRVDPKAHATLGRVRLLARRFVAGGAPGDRNQALMELGALVCTPRAPRCGACPLFPACEAARRGTPEAFPARGTREPARSLHLVAGVAFRRRRLVLVEDRELVRGHLTVPLFRVPPGKRPANVLRGKWEGAAGRGVEALGRLGVLHHSVLNRRYLVDVFALEERTPSPSLRTLPEERRRAPGAESAARIRLLRESDLSRHAHGGLLLKILALRGHVPRRK